ncbi:hypothetical protein SLEP1_g30584 [Rubroshorea leprosula]|uniref:Uncharacterized protein n=1 Tax=Rubroshorea leprosula TaxID=152421 RepID=A0AAV5K6K7_9ROSI|nr:hypothetical protein SLEP1_g30584 [Rubroshorea leprosula]
MSSEETVSVGGSEEVRALEYGDVSMTSESFDSERTKEGVGRSELVGVEGDRIPITIVEVEGRRERCYDVDADIVAEVKQYESELGTKDSLGYLVESYEISSRVLIRPIGVEEGACSAPWDHWMPVYAHYLAAGLRFPMLELFVDDTEWERRDAEVELLSSWKAKKANQNKYSLNEDEEEEVGKLVKEGGKLANIMYLTSAECIEAVELYGPSTLSEGVFRFYIVVFNVEHRVVWLTLCFNYFATKMDKFLNAAGGVAIPKKPREKSKTSTKEAGEGRAGKELVPSTSAGVEEVVPRLELKRKGSEKVGALQRKKKVVEEEVRGSKVLQFVPQPPPVELDPELRESEAEGPEARAPGKRKGLVRPLSFQSSLFEAKNATGARRFINATFPESACWVNGLTQEFMESVKDLSLLQRQCYQLQKEKEELKKKNKDMQEALDEVEKEIKAMKEAVVELKKNVQLLVHNRMEEHISNFINSSSFDNIVNLYRLPTIILAFTDCRKKVKAEYPEVDIMKITFGEQEQGVEENGRTIFPPNVDFEFVSMEEEEAKVEETEVGAGGAEVDESQPSLQVEVHLVPSDDEQPPLPAE